jgi:hypothetical protein
MATAVPSSTTLPVIIRLDIRYWLNPASRHAVTKFDHCSGSCSP